MHRREVFDIEEQGGLQESIVLVVVTAPARRQARRQGPTRTTECHTRVSGSWIRATPLHATRRCDLPTRW
jgi:hypothetical protein